MKKMAITAIVGQAFSYMALAFGIFFFIFASKYYVAILLALFGGRNGNTNGSRNWNKDNQKGHRACNRFLNHFIFNQNGDRNGRGPNGYRHQKYFDDDEPFVSIHLPFYNEKNVARRIIDACIAIDYKNYEILVIDDSRDETIEILKELSRRREPPKIKIVHRKDRRGFKGGALSEGLRHMDPRTEYISVFDADFIPPQDIIKRFLWYFEAQNGSNVNKYGNGHRFADHILSHFKNKQNNGLSGDNLLKRVDEWYERRKIAAVQGYQHHHLNKSENWITKGVRAEYSGSYMIERTAEEFFGAMKMISGSVFMLKADVARQLGWTTSITEDWDLTLRLYLAGYKVLYTPLIHAPAEIPTTVRRLASQRMRWAEGHTFAVKKYFWDVIKSPMLTIWEKLEFLYFAPYYLQSFFFLVGTVFWTIGEFLHQSPRFWTETLGWCLILSNFLSLPMMSLAGLFLESKALEDFAGIFSVIVLSHVLTPFQTFAALKGLLEKKEGTWIRTPKTGTITDKVLGIRFRSLFSWLLLERSQRRSHERREEWDRRPSTMALLLLIIMSSLKILVTVSAMTEPVVASDMTTVLTFEYEPGVVVNGIETDCILTHPKDTDLGSTPRIDSYTTNQPTICSSRVEDS